MRAAACALLCAFAAPLHAQSDAAIQSVDVRPARVPDTTVVYARVDTVALRLDLFLPKLVPADSTVPPPRWPLIIWIHGGGWRGGSRHDPSPALPLLDSGFAVANIDYRLSRTAKWPAQVHDAKAAVRWLRANADAFHIDTARFVAWGTSAGAHLAAMLGVTRPSDSLEGTVGDYDSVSSAVRAVIGYHGAFNFLEPVPRRWTRWSSVGELLGCAVPECRERARLASPITYVSFGAAPFFLAHGAADSVVPFSQAVVLDSVLRDVRVPVEFVPLPDAPHGGPEFESPGMLGRIRAFLQRVFSGAPRNEPESPETQESSSREDAGTPSAPGAEDLPTDASRAADAPLPAAPPAPPPDGPTSPQ